MAGEPYWIIANVTVFTHFGVAFREIGELKEEWMALMEAIVGPISKLLDKIIPDPQARDRAKLELIKLQGDQEMATIGAQMAAVA